MRKLIFSLLVIFSFYILSAQSYELHSPDGRIIVEISCENNLSFMISMDNEIIIHESNIDMVVSPGPIFSDSPDIDSVENNHHKGTISTVVSSKDSEIDDEFNEIILYTNLSYALNFRAYNDGVAYRFIGFFKDSVRVVDETLDLNIPKRSEILFPQENSLISHYERMYINTSSDTLSREDFCSLPMYINIGNASIVITESDLYDYPNMFMSGKENNGFISKFPNMVIDSRPKNGSDRSQLLTYDPTCIAYTNGNREFPWRIFVIGNNDCDLIESNLVFQLARPLQISDPTWIVPGKVAWDWYNANNLYGVDFVSGINTNTYEYYIDFASKFGLEYIILDEGWSISTTDISRPNNEIDLQHLINYGDKKNVGIILWVLWEPLEKNMEILEKYHSWGIAGIKVDFMQRADQQMVNYYEMVAREAAKNELLVNFHGAYKPSGLRRAYPNVLTFEGLKGNENNKWSSLITPKHNVTIPFIRMVAGPMDYTPGAMTNANIQNHSISFTRPESIGTRCHQAAMYVIYESPLQMLCDSPSDYLKDSTFTGFISNIPSVWDETKVLEGRVGEYVIIARRLNKTWFIGAMTDDKRTIEIDLSFLSDCDYKVSIMKDGANASKHAEDYIIENLSINNKGKLIIPLASGGGMVTILEPIEMN